MIEPADSCKGVAPEMQTNGATDLRGVDYSPVPRTMKGEVTSFDGRLRWVSNVKSKLYCGD